MADTFLKPATGCRKRKRVGENIYKMKIEVKEIFDKKGVVTGVILTAPIDSNIRINRLYKRHFETLLEQYIFTSIFPDEGLNIYSEINNDTFSVIALRGIDHLKSKFIELDMRITID